jgi:hypothetical protein
MRLFLLVCSVLLATAAPAGAARVETSGDGLLYSSAAGDVVRITQTQGVDDVPRSVRFSFGTGNSRPTTGPGCFFTGGLVQCTVGAELRFALDDGDDQVNAAGTAAPLNAVTPQVFDTGAGADEVVAGPADDVVRGGPGADRLTGGPGGDELDGGAGDDVIVGLDGADVVRGGDGTDTLDLSGAAAGVTVFLNGIADDGPAGTAAVDVERVLGSAFGDTLGGGDGVDVLEAGAGDDVIDVRGGGNDVADCGEGTDRAVVDAGDVPLGCEVVELPPAVPAPPPPASEPPADPPADPPAPPPVGSAPQRIPARVIFEWATFRNGSGTVARTLRVRDVPEGGRVILRCDGPGCGFAKRRVRVRDSGEAALKPLLRGRRLRAGAVVEVRVTAPGFVGKVTRFRMRRARVPVKTSLCLSPGDEAARRCS